jgi:adenine-specific DNA-methyltransferase
MNGNEPSMKKVTSEDSKSADLVAENIERLKELFPEAFSEGSVNFEILRQLLGDANVAYEGEEKYGLNWHGKNKARRIALTPSTGTLLPCLEDSLEWDTTKNLFIEGDNLEVLKLLQKSYANKIKTIYIDPPYNTGSELIYPDKYQENLETYLKYTNQINDKGFKVSSSTEKTGRLHTAWLTMIYPRLKLAKSLLSIDGFICISISDVELCNMRVILDEIFGAENFVNIINVFTKVSAGASGGGEDKRLKKNIEYVVIYAKNIQEANGLAHLNRNAPLMNVVEDMRDAGESWKYTSILVNADSREYIGEVEDGEGNPISIYKRSNVSRTTINRVCKDEGINEEQAYSKYLNGIFSDTNAQTSIRQRVIEFVGNLDNGEMLEVEYIPRSGKDKGKKVTHSYISNTVRRVIWLSDVAEVNDKGKVEKRERLGTLWDHFDYNNVGKEGGVPFPDGKKPISLIQQCLQLHKETDGIVLDFFAGSCSTPHAVFQQNSEDLGDRRFIAVQLPEPISDKKEYESVHDFCKEYGIDPVVSNLGRERIKRAGVKYSSGFKCDVGFKSFKLSTSNIRPWSPDRTDFEESLLFHEEILVEKRAEQDILYELLLKRGVDLAVPIESRQVSGKNIYSIGYGVLFACLNESISHDQVEIIANGIVAWKSELSPPSETHVFFRDSAFQNDVSKTNMAAILQQSGISHVRSL